MNTVVASWHWGLRERIGRLGVRIERLGQRVSAWGAAKKNTYPKTREEFNALIASLPTSDLELKPEVKAELLKEIEDAKQGKGLSPGFTSIKDMEEWLNAQV